MYQREAVAAPASAHGTPSTRGRRPPTRKALATVRAHHTLLKPSKLAVAPCCDTKLDTRLCTSASKPRGGAIGPPPRLSAHATRESSSSNRAQKRVEGGGGRSDVHCQQNTTPDANACVRAQQASSISRALHAWLGGGQGCRVFVGLSQSLLTRSPPRRRRHAPRLRGPAVAWRASDERGKAAAARVRACCDASCLRLIRRMTSFAGARSASVILSPTPAWPGAFRRGHARARVRCSAAMAHPRSGSARCPSWS